MKTSRLLIALLAVSCVVTAQTQAPPTPQAPVQPPAAAGPVDSAEVAALLKQFNVQGASVAVITDSRIEWARGYGVADVETGAAVSTDTMFQAASISKTVAADATA